MTKLYLAALIDPLDTNGYIVAWAVAASQAEATYILKSKVIGKIFPTMDGILLIDEDAWTRLMNHLEEDCGGLIFEVSTTS